ncbi:hypothetical protein PFISCL1PPCAC_3520, partial [Pristionchus fissidentatus]
PATFNILLSSVPQQFSFAAPPPLQAQPLMITQPSTVFSSTLPAPQPPLPIKNNEEKQKKATAGDDRRLKKEKLKAGLARLKCENERLTQTFDERLQNEVITHLRDAKHRYEKLSAEYQKV